MGHGPYGEPARTLLARHADAVERLPGQYGRLAGQAREQPGRRVLTHGEPHPGNLIETGAGWSRTVGQPHPSRRLTVGL